MSAMTPRAKHIVVIGTSAGGIEALRAVVAQLPADFAAPICVVMHVSPQSPGVLPEILRRAGTLPTMTAKNLQRLQPGQIYVAPPDCHLVVEPGRIRVTKGPRENRFRPAIDPLFRSAAQVFGPNAIGVILTGNLDDGVAGLWAIKKLGGVAVVQDPDEALFPSMPQHAVDHVSPDHVVPLAEIAPLLVRLTAAAPKETGEMAVPDHLNIEVNIAKEDNPVDAGLQQIGEPSSFSCPDCHGVLLKLKQEGRIRFRCHTGHAYSISSLLAGISEGVEHSLWTAIRALEEGGIFMYEMAEHMQTHDAEEASRLAKGAEELRAKSETLRKLAASQEPLTAP
jgi:two-component system, chemotaxis family, protein-glutamate methylesterase/glutaminase